MSTAAASARLEAPSSYDWDTFFAALGDVPATRDTVTVKRKSRDYFWYSPVLNEQLKAKFAEVVVSPRDEAEVIRAASACAKARIPLVVRGAGTGNYGQAVPLEGGVILDMAALDAIEWIKPGLVRVGAGRKMVAVDAETRRQGFELRMHPSTKRLATIGGFVAGGSGGVGSVTYGGLRELGNIVAVRVMTVEEQPRVLELRADAAQKVNRAYGTTGIITALKMPLAPAWNWIDVIVAFDDYAEAFRFGHAVALADGVVKKLLPPITWPIPEKFTAIREHCPDGKSILIAMVAHHAAASQDRPRHHLSAVALPGRPSRRIGAGDAGAVRRRGPAPQTPERLNEIIDIHERHGVMIANPHVYTLEDGRRHKRVDAGQLGFKHEVDPYGLLNPGKMRSFVRARA